MNNGSKPYLPSLATPPRSPIKKRFSQPSSPRKVITAWRTLEAKLTEVIGKSNMYSSSNPLPPPPLISSQPPPLVTPISTKALVDIDSSFFRQSSSSGSLFIPMEDINTKSPKTHSKLKATFLRLRSNSSSTSSSNATTTSPPAASKRSQSSSRRTSPTVHSNTSTTRLSNSPSSTIKHSTSFSATSSPSTSPRGPKSSNGSSRLTASPTLPPSPPMSIPRLKKAQSLIQLSSAWFRKLDSIPPVPPPPPFVAPRFDIQLPKSSSPLISTSSRSSTPTLVSTPPVSSTSTFPPPVVPANVPKNLLLSLSHRFRGESEEVLTDAELLSWRNDRGGASTPIGERIVLSSRYDEAMTEEEVASASSITTSAASSVHMFRNISQSPSLPPFSHSPTMIRSTSTSSLPNSGLAAPKVIHRKASFTPISIPALKAPRRRLELVENFPLPPIRL